MDEPPKKIAKTDQPDKAKDTPMAASVHEGMSFQQKLKLYYGKLFPFDQYHRWLSYGDDNYLKMREFSFTIEGDVYIRYQSFNNLEQMKEGIITKNPEKIDIGAIFTHPPKMKSSVSANVFQPIQKELVFDIDMTDYDEVRNCCSGADICKKCWPLMTIAVKVMNSVLKDDFGFEHVLWVYSGRRGIHCWVCDKRARLLTNEGRSAVASYMSVMSGGGESQRTFYNLDHPTTKKLLVGSHGERGIVEETFLNQIVPDQGWFKKENWSKVLSMVPPTALDKINTAFTETEGQSPQIVWNEIKAVCQADQAWDVKQAPLRILASFCYPRLDINVSKQTHHLLKSPFVIHPKTGKVCVPIDGDDPDSFRFETVPTIAQLLTEMDDRGLTGENVAKGTSLGFPLELFERFLGPLEQSIRDEALQRMGGAKKMDLSW